MILLLFVTLLVVLSTKLEIKSFPGYAEKLPFKVWSGHLQVPNTERFYYYIFTECYDPENENIFLWQQGGPGGSSLYGFIVENGIFKLQPDGETLLLNEWSWNKLGNMVWIESPAAGVGFSYDASGKHVQWNDDKYAEDMQKVLLEFMKEFPEMQEKKLYLTGESYAGRYIPVLAMHIHDMNSKTHQKDERLNLQGDGCLSKHDDYNSRTQFLLQHQIITPSEFMHVMEVCTGDPYSNRHDPTCLEAYTHVRDSTYRAHLLIYWLYSECVPDMNFESIAEESAFYETFHVPDYKADPGWEKSEDHSICTGKTPIEHYFNKREVQAAIHALNVTERWKIEADSDPGWDYDQSHYESMVPLLQILKEFYPIQLYSGDCDAAVNGVGTQLSLTQMQMKVEKEWRPWFLDDLNAGFVQNYEDNFNFVTIRGAGHMCPQIKPKRSFVMFKGFLDGDCC